jgi:hypothetical protein
MLIYIRTHNNAYNNAYIQHAIAVRPPCRAASSVQGERVIVCPLTHAHAAARPQVQAIPGAQTCIDEPCNRA